MTHFDLRLGFAPSFYRGGSIRVEGDVTGMATFEAGPTGFLPGLAVALAVDTGGMAAIRAACLAMLAGWDERWSQSGCDGMNIGGTFASPDVPPWHFSLWSPGRDSAAHAMLRAVLDCFPPERCGGAAEEQLESIRSHLGLQPPVTFFDQVPLRLRLARWAHRDDANEIATRVRALPDDGDLLVDLSGLEGLHRVLTQILPTDLLLKRRVHWRVRSNAVDMLIEYGIDPSTIHPIERPEMSDAGYPIVHGHDITSSELISLAQNGERIALVSALRKTFSLTFADAAKATAELIQFTQRHQLQSQGLSHAVAGSPRLIPNQDV